MRLFLKTILTFILILSTFQTRAQVKIDSEKQKKFNEANLNYLKNPSDGLTSGREMLKYAQNSQEKALSYLAMGKQRSDKGDFVKSVDYLQIAFDQVKESDFVDTKLEVLSYLIPAYRRAGLIIQSDENFQLLKQLSKDQPAYTSKIYTILRKLKWLTSTKTFVNQQSLEKTLLKSFNQHQIFLI